MGRAFNIGRILGIQIRIHYSWFIIFALVTVSLGWQVFPLDYPQWSPLLNWATALVTSLLFFSSVLAHELSHSLVGRANGVPIRSITLFIFGGVAQMTREAARPGAEFKMAVAGPGCSLVLGGLFALLGWLVPVGVVQEMASWLAYINIALAVFNLIPGFPLDGGRVFRSLVWRLSGNYRRATRIATLVGRGVGYLFMLGGLAIVIFRPGGLDWFSGLWLAFIGWFLENAASASYRQMRQAEAMGGLRVSQVMLPGYPVVPAGLTVDQLIYQFVLTGGRRFFLVADDDGRVAGVLTLEDIKAVPRPDRVVRRVGEIMTPAAGLPAVSPEQEAATALERLEESSTNELLVVSEGRVVGLVGRDHLLNVLRTRAELAG